MGAVGLDECLDGLLRACRAFASFLAADFKP
jgi:hypothetical protein